MGQITAGLLPLCQASRTARPRSQAGAARLPEWVFKGHTAQPGPLEESTALCMHTRVSTCAHVRCTMQACVCTCVCVQLSLTLTEVCDPCPQCSDLCQWERLQHAWHPADPGGCPHEAAPISHPDAGHGGDHCEGVTSGWHVTAGVWHDLGPHL